jgi:tRNA pseudouridine13 synthase
VTHDDTMPEPSAEDGPAAETQPTEAPRRAVDRDPHIVPAAYVTDDIPGVGGVIKQRPEDFLVDEIPLYQPAGSGEHIYMLVQKKGLSTLELISMLSTHFAVQRSAVGYAGLKDKHAITRQVISIHAPGKTYADYPMIRDDRVSVLWADQHTNKLRSGHLRGNRFSIRIRQVNPLGVLPARRMLERLVREGVPNRFGEQRFGLIENNHVIGRHIVAGDFRDAVAELLGPSARFPTVNQAARTAFVEGRYQDALIALPRAARAEQTVLRLLMRGRTRKKAILQLDQTLLSYYLSAFQSAVFNAVLDARVASRTLATLLDGDVAMKHENGALFDVDAATAADPETAARLARFEISPTGPMWGATMKPSRGATAELERAKLDAMGLTSAELDAFASKYPRLVDGSRRPLRVPLIDPEVEGGVDEHGTFIRCAFELPRGSFATVVMRELMKPERVSPENASWSGEAAERDEEQS